MLMWIHPVLQTLAVLLSLYVLYMGIIRFRFAHMGIKGLFPWKRHVQQGIIVMVVWAMAFVIGLGAALWSWGSYGITDLHYLVGLLMLPLIIFGLGSGFVMDRVKAKRTALPLAHGIANGLLVLLALTQLYTGIIVLVNMVIG